VPRARSATDPADALAFRAAREVCRRHGKDFYFASAFLPRPKRDAAHAVFAFYRMTGEAIARAGDGEPTAGAAAMRYWPLAAGGTCCSSHPLDQRLSLFGDRLNDLYEDRLELPVPATRSEAQHVLHAFARSVRRFDVPRQCFLDVAEGCRTDLLVSRYATWGSLERYCRQSGGGAAVAVACVLGLTHSGAAEQAEKLGVAVRLTHILRGLGDDAADNRLYLPLEDMAAFRYSERDLAARTVNDNFRRLMRFEIDRARRLYREAAEGVRWVAGDGSRLAAATLTVQQSAVLDAIERQEYDVFSRRPGLSAAQKLRRLPQAWRLARRGPDHAMPLPSPPADAAPVHASR
jgi:15-cis-phytoene synthase